MGNVCETIVRQFGGNRAMFMIGAKRVIFDRERGAVRFGFMATHGTHARECEIRYDAGSDTYDMTFSRVARKYGYFQTTFGKIRSSVPNSEERVTVVERHGVMCDELAPTFESVTGLYTHL